MNIKSDRNRLKGENRGPEPELVCYHLHSSFRDVLLVLFSSFFLFFFLKPQQCQGEDEVLDLKLNE